MNWRLLHKACWAGDAEEVARLLDGGADPNQVAPTNWRQTPLGRTLEFRVTSPRHAGHVETVRILLQRGADPVMRSTYLDLTPYELAAFCGLEPAADLLREFRPATEHPTGMTGLWIVAASRLPEPAQFAGGAALGEPRGRERGLASRDATDDGGWPRRSLSAGRGTVEIRS